jgi:hypothetical protein
MRQNNPDQLALFAPAELHQEPDLRGIRTAMHMLKWQRTDPTSHLYGYPISEWYQHVLRENIHQAGGLMGRW